jgi:hypothetical protein
VPVNDLCLVEAVDRFGESIVVAVADAADGRLDTGLCKPLGVSNADVLRSIPPVTAALRGLRFRVKS